MNLSLHDVLFWRLASDLLFLAALAYLGYRLLRDPYTARRWRELRELEDGLRHIVREADGAGRQLAESLRARQAGLERLLTDLDGAESRVSQVISEGESLKTTLGNDIERVRSIARELFGRQTARPAPTQNNAKTAQAEALPQHAVQARPQAAMSAAQTPVHREVQKPATTGRVNIYGEPLDQESAPPSKRSPLAAMIEKKFEKPVPDSRSQSKQAMQDVLSKAEDLLRAGNDLSSVQRTLNVPIEDLRMLETMLRNEERAQSRAARPSESARRIDPRLGVLGSPISRERRVL